MKINGIIFSIIAVATISAAASAQSKTGIRSVDFLNRTYAKGCYSGEGRKTITVVGGKFADGDDFFNVEEKVDYGDVNGDGKEDAVVRVNCGNSAGTFRDFEVDVITMAGKSVRLLARLGQPQMEADYKRTNRKAIVFNLADVDPEVEAGRLEIAAYTDGSFASPAYITSFQYKLSGAKFVLNGKLKRKKNS